MLTIELCAKVLAIGRREINDVLGGFLEIQGDAGGEGRNKELIRKLIYVGKTAVGRNSERSIREKDEEKERRNKEAGRRKKRTVEKTIFGDDASIAGASVATSVMTADTEGGDSLDARISAKVGKVPTSQPAESGTPTKREDGESARKREMEKEALTEMLVGAAEEAEKRGRESARKKTARGEGNEGGVRQGEEEVADDNIPPGSPVAVEVKEEDIVEKEEEEEEEEEEEDEASREPRQSFLDRIGDAEDRTLNIDEPDDDYTDYGYVTKYADEVKDEIKDEEEGEAVAEGENEVEVEVETNEENEDRNKGIAEVEEEQESEELMEEQEIEVEKSSRSNDGIRSGRNRIKPVKDEEHAGYDNVEGDQAEGEVLEVAAPTSTRRTSAGQESRVDQVGSERFERPMKAKSSRREETTVEDEDNLEVQMEPEKEEEVEEGLSPHVPPKSPSRSARISTTNQQDRRSSRSRESRTNDEDVGEEEDEEDSQQTRARIESVQENKYSVRESKESARSSKASVRSSKASARSSSSKSRTSRDREDEENQEDDDETEGAGNVEVVAQPAPRSSRSTSRSQRKPDDEQGERG